MDHNTVPESIGDRLLQARQVVGWSQQDLATRAGIGVPTVRAIERGQIPQASTTRRLANALGISPWRLILCGD
jgi:transcriptional regulator with XRE-family HTH domain